MTERQFPKTLESLKKIYDFITEYARTHTISEEAVLQINLAVEEVFVNMIRHSRGSREDVLVRFGMQGNTLTIMMMDRDVDSFDVTKDREVDLAQPIHERTPGGLGLHLIKSVMDDVQYAYVDRTCTIKLIKHLET